jgi:hypothetical protein
MPLGYKIDGNDLETTYGVTVYKVTGPFDFPKRKGETAFDWPDEDGEEAYTDADDIVFEARDIILSCYIKATSRTDFLTKLNSFKAVLIASGTRTLALPYTTETFTVYYTAGSALEMLSKWNSATYMGKFFVKLREPNPARPT